MKKLYIYTLMILGLFACSDDLKDATDFTSVVNPNLSEPSVVGQTNSSVIWLTGIERRMSFVLNEVLILAELGSDNYMNTQTFFSQFLDNLEIRTDDPDIRDTYGTMAIVREMARFGLTTVGPNDPEYSTITEAEYHFFEGLANLYTGMYFSYQVIDPVGPTISSNEFYQSAIASFDLALGLNVKPEYHLAKARAYYYSGDKTNAVSSANSALAADNSFVRSLRFDEAEGPANTFESALFERATFDDLQPLPSLDFLDPKYSFLTVEEDPSVHFLKAEEALLIIAEANLSDSNVLSAQQNLTDLLTLISSREVRTIDDSIEGRPDESANPMIFPERPDNTAVVVNGRSGLVLDRQAGDVSIPSISGTSLTQADIDAMNNDDNALELLYRTRQEVFIAEGLRFVDMGVKLVIHQDEFLQNPNISDGDLGTVAVIPSFIDAVKDDLDSFSYDVMTQTANTTINLNEILVSNKTSDQVLPFH